MKVLKKIITFFALTLLIIIAFLWGLTKMVNPKALSEYVNNKLTAITHQPSHIDGKITWQILPFPGIKITDLQVGDLATNPPYTLHFHSLLLNLKLKPLFQGKLIFGDVKIDGFQVFVNMNAATPPPPPSSVSVTTADSPSSETKSIEDKVNIEHFMLTHGSVILQNDSQKIQLNKIQIGIDNLNLNQKPFALQIKSTVNYLQNDLIVASSVVGFKGSVALSEAFILNPSTNVEDLSVDGQLTVQDIRALFLKIHHLSGHFTLNKAFLMIKPLAMSLYHGESMGALGYELLTKKLHINQSLSGIHADRLLNDLWHNQSVQGILEGSLHAEIPLAQDNWLTSLKANGTITMRDGLIKRVNITQILTALNDKITQLKHEKTADIKHLLDFAWQKSQGESVFKLMSMQYQVYDGKIISDNLTLQTDALNVRGYGSLDLQTHALNGRMNAKVLATNDNLTEIQALIGGGFPLIISGSLLHPQLEPDMKIIMPMLSKHWLKDALKKPVQEIKSRFKAILDAAHF